MEVKRGERRSWDEEEDKKREEESRCDRAMKAGLPRNWDMRSQETS